MKKQFLSLFALLAPIAATEAQVRFAPIFSENMVIQQNSAVEIWGTSGGGQKIAVVASWAPTDTLRVVANAHGTWRTTIQTPKADLQPHSLWSNGTQIDNILLGEVWLCSGQSNMAWGMTRTKDGDEVAATANHPNIRLFQMPTRAAEQPQQHHFGNWRAITPAVAKGASAVGFYFARKLQEELNVPVGIIVSAWGGANAETFVPKEFFDDQMIANQAIIPHPSRPYEPSVIYNQMIHPLAPLKIAGVLWYQGESNCSEIAPHYGKLMEQLIASWRFRFNNSELPFYMVQIAPNNYKLNAPYASIVREQQQRVADRDPNVGLVVISDLVDNVNDIHPKLKRDVGLRLSSYALAEVYGHPVSDYKSPTYKAMTLKSGRFTVEFNHPTAKIRCTEKAISGFTIAGADGQFVAAEAKIVDGNKVQVWSSSIAEPIAVRYCFDDTTFGNLQSAAGLPVAPFRTDNL